MIRDVNFPPIFIRMYRKSKEASKAQAKRKTLHTCVYDNYHAC